MVFHSSLLRFVGFLERVKGIPEEREALWDYRSKKDQYEYSLMKVALKNLLKEDLSSFRKDNKEVISQVEAEMKKLALSQDLDGMRRIAARLQELEKSLPQPKEEDLTFHLRNVPADISEEIKADLRELEKCYDAGCYRATIILCGRILETALHWVYYTLTKNDLLEKSPGIGLGNIIAKLKEQGVALDPALTQQVQTNIGKQHILL